MRNALAFIGISAYPSIIYCMIGFIIVQFVISKIRVSTMIDG